MSEHYQLSIYQKKYKKPVSSQDVDEVNLTSLLDVLIILLFFLLMSYNPSVLSIDPLKNVNPPFSESLEMGKEAIIIQVSSDKEVFLEKRKLGNLDSQRDEEALESVFKKEFELQKQKFLKKFGAKDEQHKSINFILDGNLKYEQMEKLMLIASKSGFDNYKFVVRSKSKD
ncbi:MAG: biopolymer transporter ExbD [Bacteriovoracaceae bacterium]|nr:biopolymer transporter ExbD [Bacteriovoracaceae bacterium]